MNPSRNMNLPPEITALLQDEAYATLCHESLTEALARISREKEEILSTRPPFGMLASSQTRQVFQTSLRAALDNEAGLTTRLDQINQIDLWLKSAIEKALTAYLPTVSVEYRTCNDAALVVTRWEHTIEALHEISLALARDAHAVGAALNPIAVANTALPTPTLIEQARIRALTNLRATVMALQSGIADVMEVRAQFAELADQAGFGSLERQISGDCRQPQTAVRIRLRGEIPPQQRDLGIAGRGEDETLQQFGEGDHTLICWADRG